MADYCGTSGPISRFIRGSFRTIRDRFALLEVPVWIKGDSENIQKDRQGGSGSNRELVQENFRQAVVHDLGPCEAVMDDVGHSRRHG